jgi:hypothetical protein
VSRAEHPLFVIPKNNDDPKLDKEMQQGCLDRKRDESKPQPEKNKNQP